MENVLRHNDTAKSVIYVKKPHEIKIAYEMLKKMFLLEIVKITNQMSTLNLQIIVNYIYNERFIGELHIKFGKQPITLKAN